MKKRYKYLAIQEVKKLRVFGEYLKDPATDKARREIIGERLAYLREQAELSQKDVCEIIGVAPTTYSGYEVGQHEPTAETICRIAELYKIAPEFILGKGAKTKNDERMPEQYITAKDANDLDMDTVKNAILLVKAKAENFSEEK